MSLTGPGPDDPQKVGTPIGDMLSGMFGAYGVLAALHERERTGRGSTVRTSLLAAIVGVHAYQGTRWTVAGQVPHAQGNHHPSISPYGLFHCADGAVQIALGSEALWRRFCAGFGRRPRHRGPGLELRAGRPPRRRHRADRERVRRVGGSTVAGAAERGRCPGRQGPNHGRGLRLGPGALAGADASRSITRHSGRSGCPGRRCGSSEPTAARSPAPSTSRHRRWTAMARRCAGGSRTAAPDRCP